MNENEIMQEEEISLFDLWERLRWGWRYVVGGMVLGLLGAGLAIGLIAPKYEATAIVQIGLIGSPGKEVQGGNSIPVEPASQSVERMKTPAFQLKVATSAGDQDWLDALANSNTGVAKDLSLQVIKATVGAGQSPLVELKTMGGTPEIAKKKAEISVSQLAKIHQEIAAPTLSKMNAELSLLKQKLAIAEKENRSLNKAAASAGGVEERISPMSLMGTVRAQKETELRQNILGLETALSVPATQPTKTIEEIYVSARPVSPKQTLLLVLGLVGGLLAGIVVAFVVASWRRSQLLKQSMSS